MKKPFRALILQALTLIYFVASPVAFAQQLTEAWVKKMATPLIENRVADGLSIGYLEGKNWGIVHLGVANRRQEKANNVTIYELGSISKVMTGLLVADAVVRGQIDLDAAAAVENSAELRLPSRNGQPITWLDLSTHRSGLPRLPANLVPNDPTNPYRDYDSKLAAAFLNGYQPPRTPGEAYEYSNFGVSVLGYLIAENEKKSYEQLLVERIAKPLRMADCTVSLSSDQRKRMATPHERVGTPAAQWTFADLPGAGGVHATIRDMMRFAKAQLTPPSGKLGEAIELAWQQHHAADASGPAMSLGWHLAGDGQTRWHNGQTGGTHTSLFINRELKFAAVVLCNTAVSSEIDQLAMQMVMKAAGQEVNPPLSKRVEQTDQPPKLSPFTAVQFQADTVIVKYQGQQHRWQELNGIATEDVLAAAKKQFSSQWKKRVREDLVEVLWGMGHRPGTTVMLRLHNIKSNQELVVYDAPMTAENREAIRNGQAEEKQAVATDRGNSEVAIDADLRSRLVGRYQLAPDFIFDVQDRDGRLMVGITNQPTQEVFADSPTHWSYRGVKAMLEFKLRKSGPAQSLVLHQNGARQVARRMK